MKAWAVVAAGKPLEEIELPMPEPKGREILMEVTQCGVCHSDLHFWKGEYNLGGGKIMKIADRGVTLPRAPGHEIVGRVVKLGPEAEGVRVGDQRVIYPWLGCGKCDRCARSEDNLCTAQRSLGVIQHGGFASHVLVPDSHYLVDFGHLDPALAATYACSGLTAHAAIRKIMPLDPDKPVVLIGAGGVGLTAIAMLRALGHRAIISVDVDEKKREAAREEGARDAVDGASEGLTQRILAASGGPVAAVIDFVNISATARTALEVLAKGGILILVGVTGGEIELSLASMIFRALRIEGCNTGSIQELRDVLVLAKAGKLKPIPIERMLGHEANEALLRLRDGKVTGRVVLDKSRPLPS